MRREAADLAARRATYRELRRLGRRRESLEEALATDYAEILAIIRSARPNIDMGEAAAAVGVARQTLHRWLNLKT